MQDEISCPLKTTTTVRHNKLPDHSMEAVTPNGRHNPRDAGAGIEGGQTLLLI